MLFSDYIKELLHDKNSTWNRYYTLMFFSLVILL